MPDMKQLISYFTTQSTPLVSTYVWIAFALAGVFLLIGFLIPLIEVLLRRKKQSLKHGWVWNRLASIFRIAGVVWLLLLFLRFEGLQPFTMRIWFYLSIVPFVVWALWVGLRYRKMIPHVVYEDALHKRFGKYLPQQKVRKRQAK